MACLLQSSPSREISSPKHRETLGNFINALGKNGHAFRAFWISSVMPNHVTIKNWVVFSHLLAVSLCLCQASLQLIQDLAYDSREENS